MLIKIFYRIDFTLKGLLLLLVFVCAIPSAVAYAPLHQKFKVQAEIKDGCNIYWLSNQRPSLNFGNIVTAQGDAAIYRAQTQFEVNCTPGTKAYISINSGQHPSFSGSRQLFNSTTNSELPYQLYTDSAATQPWVSNKGVSYNQFPTPVTIYAQLTADKPVPTGRYSDTLTVTLSY